MSKNTKTTVNPNDVKTLYKELRTVPLDQWPEDAELVKRFQTGGKAGAPNFDGAQFDLSHAQKLRLMGRIAQSCSEKEFLDLALKGDLPPVKLTQNEADTLRGGFITIPFLMIGIPIGIGVELGAKSSEGSSKKIVENTQKTNFNIDSTRKETGSKRDSRT